MIPKRLYHGTSIRNLESILKDGILPRRASRRANSKTFLSASNRVYLASSGHAIRFAVDALKDRDSGVVIFEINALKLNPNKLISDEDCLFSLPQVLEMPTFKGRVAKAQDIAVNYPASKSLEIGGSCAYLGDIIPSKIIRYATIDYKAQFGFLIGCWDTSTSPLAWNVSKDRHDARIEWLFDCKEPTIPPNIPKEFEMMFKPHPTGDRTGILVHENTRQKRDHEIVI